MHRFFVAAEAITGDAAVLTGEQAHQIINVLRLKCGDQVVLLDDTGYEYEVEITALDRTIVEAKIIGKQRGVGEPATTVMLYQALIKPDRFEMVLQKVVELGVSRIWPFVSERCVAGMPSPARLGRWQSIIREAAEQSRRAILPVLYEPMSFELLCKESPVPGIILWEEEKSLGLSQVLRSPPFQQSRLVRVFVGPEGGFTSAEIVMARQRGVAPVSLGKRILRTETAGLVAVSAIMYEKGELG